MIIFFFVIFREIGSGREREREKPPCEGETLFGCLLLTLYLRWSLKASHVPYPDWNLKLSRTQDYVQPTEPHCTPARAGKIWGDTLWNYTFHNRQKSLYLLFSWALITSNPQVDLIPLYFLIPQKYQFPNC